LQKYAQKGILISGASGSGKTIAAKVIVEELLQDNIPTFVFDYTKQWQRLVEKNTNKEMINQYRQFGMKSPKAFESHVLRELSDPDQFIHSDIATIMDLSDITNKADRVEIVARMLDRLLEYFQFQDDSDRLKLLVVVEEAHLWTSRDLPKEAMLFLDSAVRLLRKKGVGIMLISHKISDFDPAMRAAMNINIIFNTKYEGDLNAFGKIFGSKISKLVPRLPVGHSVFHLADIGDPFVTAWRPLYSQI
jgi:DNA helicase HerA-like ATPase